MSNSWSETQQVISGKRFELIISGSTFVERIKVDGLDPEIFKIPQLNLLEISNVYLEELPPDIGLLHNLTRLVLSHNKLTKIPSDIQKLTKLKILDASHNMLSELPSEIGELRELQSLNLSANKLSAIPPLNNMLRLNLLNISDNNFQEFPVSICDSKLIHFTDLLIGNNAISTIPAEVENLTCLKVLDLSNNDLVSVPGELANCGKIKQLNLKGNKLKDKRLLKLVDKNTVKQVLDYIKLHCPKANSDNNQQAKSKKSKQTNKTEDEEVVESSLDELKILHVSDDSLKVVITPRVADVRPHIVCCKVLEVDLSPEGLMKKFITMQTKLHDTICEKRTAATIATHDFAKIQGDLLYDARPPKGIKIFPLNRKKEVTFAQLYAQLNDEADTIRKEKKKNTYSGIHKFLYLLKDKPLYPCLVDSSGLVISFPPITNAEGTKISNDTKSMLLEVTGNNLNTCKRVMDTLLIEMLKLGLGNESPQTEDSDENETPQKKFLRVQQIKIVDEEGQLKVVYPSRTDVVTENVLVTRE